MAQTLRCQGQAQGNGFDVDHIRQPEPAAIQVLIQSVPDDVGAPGQDHSDALQFFGKDFIAKVQIVALASHQQQRLLDPGPQCWSVS